jgi:hypothetical protein
MRQSPELLLAQAQAIAQVRESWAEVERNPAQVATAVPPSASEGPSVGAPVLSLGA